MRGGGKGALIQDNKSATLSTHNTQTLFEPIPIADKATRANISSGGNGLGGKAGEPADTLTVRDRHAVAYGIDRAAFNQGKNAQYNISIQEECAQTLVAKGPGAVAQNNTASEVYAIGNGQVDQTGLHRIPGALNCMHDQQSIFQINKGIICEYIVRRLTPLECSRLQGFPDEWVQDFKMEVTEETIDFWMQVFEDYRITVEPDTKPKTRKQVRRWLENPRSDSSEYEMWGNGIALPCAVYVMDGIAEVLREEAENEV